MAGEEGVCVGLVVLLGIVFVLYILVKFAKLFAYVGAWRSGKALKKISKQGLVIHQSGQWQQPSYPQIAGQQSSTRQLRQQRHPAAQAYQPYESTCPYCGAMGYAGQLRCTACGRPLVQQPEAKNVIPPTPVRVKERSSVVIVVRKSWPTPRIANTAERNRKERGLSRTVNPC